MKLKKFVRPPIHSGGMWVGLLRGRQDVILRDFLFSGLKYEKENEEDLKDQINFPHLPKKYPPNRKQSINTFFEIDSFV